MVRNIQPVNKIIGKQYNGINIPLLWASADEQGFHTNERASFQQWKEKVTHRATRFVN